MQINIPAAASLDDIVFEAVTHPVTDELDAIARKLPLSGDRDAAYAALASERFLISATAGRALGFAEETERFLALAHASAKLQVVACLDMLTALTVLNSTSVIAVAILPPQSGEDVLAREFIAESVDSKLRLSGDSAMVEVAALAFDIGPLPIAIGERQRRTFMLASAEPAPTKTMRPGVPVHAWSCATNSDAMQLITGHPTSWRGARMGLLTEALVTSTSASPIFLLDELDKFLTHRDEQPFNILLNILEAENAEALLDEYLRVRFDASHAIFIATANDTSVLPEFIHDRFLVAPIASPTGDALIAVTRQIAVKIVRPLGLPMPDNTVLAVLARHNPRRIGRVLRLALGFAAADGRKVLLPTDIHAADALGSREGSPAQIGFIRPKAKGKTDRE